MTLPLPDVHGRERVWPERLQQKCSRPERLWNYLNRPNCRVCGSTAVEGDQQDARHRQGHADELAGFHLVVPEQGHERQHE